MKRITKIVTAALVGVMGLLLFAACGGNNGPSGGVKGTTYTYEAEHIDLSEQLSNTESGNIYGKNLCKGDGTNKNWSGGYYVGPSHYTDFTFLFRFTADEAAEASLEVLLGSTIGNLTLMPSIFGILLNGEEIDYGSWTVSGSTDENSVKFSKKTIATKTDIGTTNTLQLIVRENTLFNGGTGGPMVDCVKITTKAKLDWEKINNATGGDEA